MSTNPDIPAFLAPTEEHTAGRLQGLLRQLVLGLRIERRLLEQATALAEQLTDDEPVQATRREGGVKSDHLVVEATIRWLAGLSPYSVIYHHAGGGQERPWMVMHGREPGPVECTRWRSYREAITYAEGKTP
jgi:hypothetical protein